jgi:hypothetical protein
VQELHEGLSSDQPFNHLPGHHAVKGQEQKDGVALPAHEALALNTTRTNEGPPDPAPACAQIPCALVCEHEAVGVKYKRANPIHVCSP